MRPDLCFAGRAEVAMAEEAAQLVVSVPILGGLTGHLCAASMESTISWVRTLTVTTRESKSIAFSL